VVAVDEDDDGWMESGERMMADYDVLSKKMRQDQCRT
jgi:hypothetical protein